VKSSRLLSILLLLQNRGRMTAAQLAAELEVSVRTVYRDIEALHASGVPLYGDAGHAGGYELLGGYRTRLTGFNATEAEALFLSGIPGPAAELGMASALATAQLKLHAALPPELRAQADRMRSRFHLDAPGWYAPDSDVPYLTQVAEAVWQSQVLDVRYRRWKTPTDVDRRLEPYGLVLKAGRWYLIAAPGPRTYRVDQIIDLRAREETFQPPPDFDLAGYWQRYRDDFLSGLYTGCGRGPPLPGGATVADRCRRPSRGRHRHPRRRRLDPGGTAHRIRRYRAARVPRARHRDRGTGTTGATCPPRGHCPGAGHPLRQRRVAVAPAAELHALTRTLSALSTGVAAWTALSGETSARFREQRSSAYSTMIMVPPGPGKTDHLIPGTSACARVHRDISCLVVICTISVTPVITLSLLHGVRSALRGHGDPGIS
jgi:predicted DNA-binding transcriptional regulator YafY